MAINGLRPIRHGSFLLSELVLRLGIEGRFDEHEAKMPADKNKLNDLARDHYLAECAKLIGQLNQLVPEGQPKLYAPHLKFNRSIGEHVGKTYSVTGELLSPEAYKKHLPEVLPTLTMKEY